MKTILILICFFLIISIANKSFATSVSSDNVTVQQDVSALALRDIDTVRSIIASNESLRNMLSSYSSQDLCYGIIPSVWSDNSDLHLIIYRKSWIIGQGNDINYYGITTTSFNISAFTLVSIYRGGYSSNYYSGQNKAIPSFYYLRSLVELTDGLDSNSSVVSSVEESTNSIKENTEVSQETQNFIKDDTQVADSDINDMKNSFNSLDIQDDASSKANSLFDIFRDNKDEQYARYVDLSFKMPFTNQDVTVHINRGMTKQMLYLFWGPTVESAVTSIVYFLWSMLILRFLFVNIVSLIDKIKTGDITSINTKNIIVDIL